MNKIPVKLKFGLMFLAFAGTFYWMFSKPVIEQDLSYHSFIDVRSLWGIPNVQNVLTNIFFLMAGFLGLSALTANQIKTKKSWWWFFVSIILVAPGSAYYHWEPNNTTLVWDRLPMSMGFMALYVVLLSEHISFKIEKFLYLALSIGLLSIGVWVFTTDLRFYFWIQFSSFLTIPMILFLFPSSYSKKYWYFITLVIYGLAKWVEILDREIYYFTSELISGHALKHILAALGLAGLWWMVKTRKEMSQTVSTWSVADSSPALEKTL
jgi:hypothetical protein